MNPFVVDAVWFSAAARIVVPFIGPSSFDTELAASNYIVSVVTIDQVMEFCDSMDILTDGLVKIEVTLKSAVERASSNQ